MKHAPINVFSALIVLLSACVGERHAVTKSVQFPEPSDSLKSMFAQAGAGQFVFIDGEFKQTGRFPWTNGMRLQDAINMGGGFTDFARRRLDLRHEDGAGEHYRLGRGRSIQTNPALKPGDSVLTPRQDY